MSEKSELCHDEGCQQFGIEHVCNIFVSVPSDRYKQMTSALAEITTHPRVNAWTQTRVHSGLATDQDENQARSETIEATPVRSDQQEWFGLIKAVGNDAARATLVSRLRYAADQIERGGFPDVFGCHLSGVGESLPMETISVTLSDVWPG